MCTAGRVFINEARVCFGRSDLDIEIRLQPFGVQGREGKMPGSDYQVKGISRARTMRIYARFSTFHKCGGAATFLARSSANSRSSSATFARSVATSRFCSAVSGSTGSQHGGVIAMAAACCAFSSRINLLVSGPCHLWPGGIEHGSISICHLFSRTPLPANSIHNCHADLCDLLRPAHRGRL